MVLVSHKHEFIYLKTHKTASTSCEAALEHLCMDLDTPETHSPKHFSPMMRSAAGIVGARGNAHLGPLVVWRNHMPAWQVALFLGPRRWLRYRKVAVLRNPYDRAVSYYFQRLNFERRDWAASAGSGELVDEFRKWLPTADLSRNLNKIQLAGRVCIDHFLFFETLESDLVAFKQEVGADTPINLPTYKSGRRTSDMPYTEYYDAAAREVVAAKNRLELELGGYGFGTGPERASGKG